MLKIQLPRADVNSGRFCRCFPQLKTFPRALSPARPQAPASGLARCDRYMTDTGCAVGSLQDAIPEDIPLDIVYEDDHLLVVNKPAGMVAHLSPGHATGTLVNALLHHCGMPTMTAVPG